MDTTLVEDAQTDKRVLIVDDDQDFADSLADILDLSGYEAIVASTAGEAEALAERYAPKVALLDVRLGPGSGIDLIPALTARDSGIICVMMTAYATMDTAIEAMQKGAYDYMRKPLTRRTCWGR